MVLVVKNLPANAGDARDMGSIPRSGRSSGVGNDNPLQCSCLENSIDREAWQGTVHGVAKSQAQLSTTHTHIPLLIRATKSQWSELCFSIKVSTKQLLIL